MRKLLFKHHLRDTSQPNHYEIVLDGLNNLRHMGELVDVRLIIEEQEFKAHRVVLSACSDYFRAMFCDNMLESKKDVIFLKDLSAKGFAPVLEYVYTGKIVLNLDNVQEVLQVASLTQMLNVIQTCSDYLESEIDHENCVDICNIAENYSMKTLKDAVYRYMSVIFSTFTSSTEFYRLNFEQLKQLLKYEFPVDCSECEVLKAVVEWFINYSVHHNLNVSDATEILELIKFNQIKFSDIWKITDRLKYLDQNEKVRATIVSYLKSTLDYQMMETKLLNSRGMEMAILKVGGFGHGGVTNEITYRLFSESKWKHLTRIPHVDQSNFGVCVLNNELYIFGGCFDGCQFMQEEIHPFGFKYTPFNNTWSTPASMKMERCRFSLNVLGNHIYAVGGVTDALSLCNITNTCEKYDPKTDQWQYIPSLPTYVTQHASASCEDNVTKKLFISGGVEGYYSSTVLNTMWCFNEKTNRWSACSNMLRPRADHVMLNINNVLYACGGWYEDDEETRIPVDTIDAYFIDDDRWEVVTTIPNSRHHAGIVNIGEKIYFICGHSHDAVSSYHVTNDIWYTEDNYPEDAWEHICVAMYIPNCLNSAPVLPL